MAFVKMPSFGKANFIGLVNMDIRREAERSREAPKSVFRALK